MPQNEFTKPPRAADIAARKKALEKAMALYEAYLLGYFYRRTRDYPIAEDLAQQVWVNMFRTFSIYQMTQIALILRKARQVLIDYKRKEKVRDFISFTSSVPDAQVSFEEMVEKTSTEKDAKERFWEQFSTIDASSEQKDAFWLHFYTRHTLEEIAAVIKKPRSTVYEWIERVKRECSKHYQEE